jgi:hypothetical protein
MTTELQTNAHVSVPSHVSAMQDIPLGQIQESKTNPRRQFDQAKLAELADNIRQHGVLQSTRPRSRRMRTLSARKRRTPSGSVPRS